MFSATLQWLAGSALYPRWAFCLLFFAALVLLTICVFLLWTSIELYLDRKATEVNDIHGHPK